MRIYEVGLRTSSGTIAAAALEIRAHASRMARLIEIQIAMAAATASVFGIGRPANSGAVAGGSTNAPPAPDTDDVGAFAGSLILAGWTTAPTAPTSFFRRLNLPGVIGEKEIYRPARLIEIPPGGSLVLWNITATGVADVNLVLEDVGP